MASDPLGNSISGLTAADTLTGAEIVPLTQTTVTRRTTLQLIADWIVQTAASFVQSGTGAVARTGQEKLREIISLDDFSTSGQYDTQKFAASRVTLCVPGELEFSLTESSSEGISFVKDVAGESAQDRTIAWYGGSGAMPYLLSAYHNATGAFANSTPIIVSNKRIDVNGAIQGVSALANGSEPSMVAISPDVNGPALAIEGYSTLSGGQNNGTAIAIYDINDIVGGATAYSAGYGTKKFAISGNGTMFWGSNLGITPAVSFIASIALVSNDLVLNTGNNNVVIGSGGTFKLTDSGSGNAAIVTSNIQTLDGGQLWLRNAAGSITYFQRTAAGDFVGITAGGGIGYGTGAGGTVAQGAGSGKATGVTLHKITGEITMDAAALAADTTVSFTLANNAIAAGDYVAIQHVSAGTQAAYNCTALAAVQSATINVRNITPGSLSEAIVLKYVVIRAVTA